MTKHFVKTLINCQGSHEDELLAFQAGDLLEVSCLADIGWWKGTSMHTMETGYFDQTMVEIIEEAEAYFILHQRKLSSARGGNSPVSKEDEEEEEEEEKTQRRNPKTLQSDPDIRKSLKSILFAIDLELELLQDACDIKISPSGPMARSQSLPEKLDLVEASTPRPSKPLPPIPGNKGSLTPFPPLPSKETKPRASLPVALSSGEISPPPPPVPAPRFKRSVTNPENLGTPEVTQDARIQERANYLSERKREFTSALRNLGGSSFSEEKDSSRKKGDLGAKKTVAFLCEQEIIPGEKEKEDGEKKKKSVWSWMSRKKRQRQQQQQPEQLPYVIVSF